jgi:hypothetical protein
MAPAGAKQTKSCIYLIIQQIDTDLHCISYLLKYCELQIDVCVHHGEHWISVGVYLLDYLADTDLHCITC